MRRPGPRQGTIVCVHTHMGMEQFCQKLIRFVLTEAVHPWSRVAPLLTPWCAEGEVPTGVTPNRYAGDGSCTPWHRDNERLLGCPVEPKVIVSMSLGQSVLFKLRRRTLENAPSGIWLEHGDLLVMDGTQSEHEHSTTSELSVLRVNLAFHWISQHIKSCPLAGLIGRVLPSDAQDLVEFYFCGRGSRKWKCPRLVQWSSLWYMLSLEVCIRYT